MFVVYISALGKKVGADGMSKKERRALKVAQKDSNTITNVENGKTSGSTKPNINKSTNKVVTVPIKQSEKINVNIKVANTAIIEEKQSKQSTNLNDKKINTESVTPIITPSKAQLRAERRAVQEKQRLAKVIDKVEKPEKDIKESSKVVIKPTTKKNESKPNIQNEHRVYLFSHLYFNNSIISEGEEQITDLHSSFIKLGVCYSAKTILGSNARCLALLYALREFVIDFSPPTNQEFCRSVELYLQRNVSYLQKCRPFAVSMTNALKHFKLCLTQIDTNLSDIEKIEKLLEVIDTYKQEQIAKAGEAISIKVNEKITNNDVILTYGW